MLPKDNYSRWLFEREDETDSGSLEELAYQPLISILMPVYNASPYVLSKAIRSVTRQTYQNWQLCIADDCSTRITTRLYLKSLFNKKIRIEFLDQNINISGASNRAAQLATGEYIALLDNDDELDPNALYEIVRCLNDTRADLVYSDEDFIDLYGEYESPHFKPDYSPDLLLSHNYITHFTAFRKKHFDRLGGFRSEFDGAQDYDLLLRLVEIVNRIEHVPRILYHWRKSQTSSSMGIAAKPYTHEAGKAALKSAIKRRGIEARVCDGNLPNYYQVTRKISGEPLVSIIIPFKDKPDLLADCLHAILRKTRYRHFEIIGVSNNSTEPGAFEIMSHFSDLDQRCKFVEHNVPFNFSALVNFGFSKSRGEHIILMNNDIEVINEQWLEAMLEHSQRQEIAVVGAKLYFGNQKIQHAGVGIGLGGAAGHLHLNFPHHSAGYFNRLNVIQNISAVTGALMMVKRTIYDSLGGFDEHLFKIAYNDVDFCLRAIDQGYVNIFTPFAEAYHYESVSRGYDQSGEKLERLNHEKKNLWKIHGERLSRGDPYYNPNLDQDRDDFELPYKPLL